MASRVSSAMRAAASVRVRSFERATVIRSRSAEARRPEPREHDVAERADFLPGRGEGLERHQVEVSDAEPAHLDDARGAVLGRPDESQRIAELGDGLVRNERGRADRRMATIGQVGNLDHENVSLGKAGRKRWMGKRPHNRGVSMNPVDHPHGGGEGKTSGGRHPVTPWGQPTRGFKTRNNKRTNKWIVTRKAKKR